MAVKPCFDLSQLYTKIHVQGFRVTHSVVDLIVNIQSPLESLTVADLSSCDSQDSAEHSNKNNTVHTEIHFT